MANGQTSATQTADPRSVVLVGDRFQPLRYDDMTHEQQAMIDHLFAGERGAARGPFNVLLRSPEAGDLFQQFGGSMRFHTATPKDVGETIIIMTGRFWMAQYEWYAHKATALQLGVNRSIVDSIAGGKRPSGMPPDMELAYNLIDELLTTHQVTDSTFQAAKARYGEQGIVDIVGLSGWYCMVSMTLNVDRYPLPAGVEPELQSLENPLPVVGAGLATPLSGMKSPAQAVSTINGKTLTLTGGRFSPLHYEEMTTEQRKVTEAAVAAQDTAGILSITLRHPEAASLLVALGQRVRSHMAPPAKLTEMARMLMARYWGNQAEWLVHSEAAVQAGLSAGTAKAIAEGKRPAAMRPDEEKVYDFFSELIGTKRVSDATFAAVKALLGERGLVDLVICAGYEQLTCMFLNVDRASLNPGARTAWNYPSKPIP
jgi:4-carboxymuconolactone decarboxylase